MGLRPRRRNLVVWSSSAVPAGDLTGRARARPTRIVRIRWWVRAAALLAIIGVLWLARSARSRWEPVFLFAGTAATLVGIIVPAAAAFFAGLLVLILTLLKGISCQAQ